MAEKIIIVGSGWAGYTLAHDLSGEKFEITVVSPESTTPYTPLLASAACGLFNFSLAEEPVRHKNKPLKYVQAWVDAVDFEKKTCLCKPAFESMAERVFTLPYDKIVIAPGCTSQTFGTPGVAEHALFVKNVKDAMAVRARLQDIVEMASLSCVTEEEQRNLLHIVVVGGGPTGVEISAEMTDLIVDDFSVLYPGLKDKFSIAIHDVAAQILSAFDEKLSKHALNSFVKSNVKVNTGSHITKVEAGAIHTKEDGAIPYGMLIWATGNKQVPLVDSLNVSKSGRLPRISTNDFLNVLGTSGEPIESAYAIGDAADVKGGELPTTAEVACQKAAHIAKCFNTGNNSPFAYVQQSLIAYTGQHDGVVAGKSDWSGQGAWLAWRAKNLNWSRSWRNRILISMNWSLNHVFGKEIART